MKAPLVRIIGAVLALALVVGGVWAYRGAQARQREEALAAAATALAKALKAGDVPAGLIDGAPDVKALLAQASDVPHTVEVAATTMDGDSATARLHHGWTLQPGAPTYGYDVTAKLTRRDDRWVATWSPDLLAPGAQAGDLLRTVRRTAARAEVLGQGDQPLVTARPVVFVGIDRSLVAKDVAVASAARLAQAMEVDVQPYVDAGATGFGLGSALYKPGMTAEQVAAVAIRFVAGWRALSGR